MPLTSLDSQPTDEKEVLVENPQKSSLNEEQIEAGNIAVTTNLTVSRVARDPVHDDDDAADDAEDDTETAKDTDEEMFTFTNLLAHRWSGDEIEMEVDWHGSEPTWELEMNLHRDAPDALFAYWRAQGGRPENPRDPGLYDIFAIRKHSRNRLRLLVEWTGYPPEDNTWESRKMLEETAPEVLAEYWESVKPTLKRGPKK